MLVYPDTELILNTNKKVYHLDLNGDDIADEVIVVGDQNRVAQISRYFSKIEFKTQHREFVTHTGIYNGKRITVLSTGIGTDNIDIVLNELDAAVNIDLETRQNKKQNRHLNILRLGTSGALQDDVPVNALVASAYGLGLDGLLNFYQNWEKINETEISEAFTKQCHWPAHLAHPYCISGSQTLLDRFTAIQHKGITATAPGFYGPQGREIRLKANVKQLPDLLATFKFNDLRITNFEMETSALYGLGKLLGHNCLTVCVIIANRKTKTFTNDYKKSEQLLIESCLNQLSNSYETRRTDKSN